MLESLDYEEKKSQLRSKAESGDDLAMCELGELLEENGEIREAESWYLRSAELGNSDAMNILGMLHEDREMIAESEKWYLAAATKGNAGAMCNLGLLKQTQGEPDEAIEWLQKAIDLGDETAVINLGILYTQQKQLVLAEKTYRRGVELGSGQAMTNLAILLKGMERVEEAKTLLLSAAALNSNKAMNNLALLYRDQGDLVSAEHWLRKSLEIEENEFAQQWLSTVLKEAHLSTQSTVVSCVICGIDATNLSNSYCEDCSDNLLMTEEEAIEKIWNILMEDEPNWEDIADIFATRNGWDEKKLKFLIGMWPEDIQDAYHEQVLKMQRQEFLDESISELEEILSEVGPLEELDQVNNPSTSQDEVYDCLSPDQFSVIQYFKSQLQEFICEYQISFVEMSEEELEGFDTDKVFTVVDGLYKGNLGSSNKIYISDQSIDVFQEDCERYFVAEKPFDWESTLPNFAYLTMLFECSYCNSNGCENCAYKGGYIFRPSWDNFVVTYSREPYPIKEVL